MSDKSYPYISSGGAIALAIEQFRKSFPAAVDAATLKKLSIAPNNESYLINIFKFIGALDEEGKRTAMAQSVFSKHNDEEFQKAFEAMIRTAYKDLFELRGDDAWDSGEDALISFFRNTDGSTAIVGKRQATTFRTLTSFAGHGATPPAAKPAKKNVGKAARVPIEKAVHVSRIVDPESSTAGGSPRLAPPVGLTVRIEVNLPAAAEQDTYDKIFKSIRENLLNAK